MLVLDKQTGNEVGGAYEAIQPLSTTSLSLKKGETRLGDAIARGKMISFSNIREIEVSKLSNEQIGELRIAPIRRLPVYAVSVPTEIKVRFNQAGEIHNCEGMAVNSSNAVKECNYWFYGNPETQVAVACEWAEHTSAPAVSPTEPILAEIGKKCNDGRGISFTADENVVKQFKEIVDWEFFKDVRYLKLTLGDEVSGKREHKIRMTLVGPRGEQKPPKPEEKDFVVKALLSDANFYEEGVPTVTLSEKTKYVASRLVERPIGVTQPFFIGVKFPVNEKRLAPPRTVALYSVSAASGVKQRTKVHLYSAQNIPQLIQGVLPSIARTPIQLVSFDAADRILLLKAQLPSAGSFEIEASTELEDGRKITATVPVRAVRATVDGMSGPGMLIKTPSGSEEVKWKDAEEEVATLNVKPGEVLNIYLQYDGPNAPKLTISPPHGAGSAVRLTLKQNDAQKSEKIAFAKQPIAAAKGQKLFDYYVVKAEDEVDEKTTRYAVVRVIVSGGESTGAAQEGIFLPGAKIEEPKKEPEKKKTEAKVGKETKSGAPISKKPAGGSKPFSKV